MASSKLPNPTWSLGVKTRVKSHNPTDEDLPTTTPTTATRSAKKRVASGSPQSVVNSIYELKQTAYDLARHVCSGGKSDRIALAVSSGVKLRVVHTASEANNPQQRLQELQSRVQDLLHKIETGVCADGRSKKRRKTKTPNTGICYICVDMPNIDLPRQCPVLVGSTRWLNSMEISLFLFLHECTSRNVPVIASTARLRHTLVCITPHDPRRDVDMEIPPFLGMCPVELLKSDIAH